MGIDFFSPQFLIKIIKLPLRNQAKNNNNNNTTKKERRKEGKTVKAFALKFHCNSNLMIWHCCASNIFQSYFFLQNYIITSKQF